MDMASNDDFGIGSSLPWSRDTELFSEEQRAARLLKAHKQAVKLFDLVTESDILRPGVRDSEATLAIRCRAVRVVRRAVNVNQCELEY
jgi:hypothetical protein